MKLLLHDSYFTIFFLKLSFTIIWLHLQDLNLLIPMISSGQRFWSQELKFGGLVEATQQPDKK